MLSTISLKRIFIIFVLSAALLLAIIQGLSFKVIGYRKYDGKLNQKYEQELCKMLVVQGIVNKENIQDVALSFTAKNLKFAFQKNPEINPNLILKNRFAHCIMYSYVFTASYNALAKANKINNKSRIGYGHFYWYGINLHQFISSSFFASHDVCVIRKSSGEMQIIDSLMYDYFFLKNFPITK